MSIGLLAVRVVVGALFFGHGSQKLFGWFGGHGVKGVGKFFDQVGYRPGEVNAVLAGICEAGGGSLIALGLLTPLGSAVIVGVMVATLAVHWPKGLWNTDGGFELPLVYATVVIALAFAGAGRYSLDAVIGWRMSGMALGTAAAAVGALGGTIALGLRKPRPALAEQKRRAA
jgi:putative oxidoreductase